MNDNLYWYISRGSGIVAYLLINITVCLGIALSRHWRSQRIPRLVVNDTHRWLALTFYSFVAVHVVTIYLDSYSHFSVVDVLLPGASPWKTLGMAFGIIAAELGV